MSNHPSDRSLLSIRPLPIGTHAVIAQLRKLPKRYGDIPMRVHRLGENGDT
jgi:hypothetical protein